MFLRLPLRTSGLKILMNLNHVVKVEPGGGSEDEEVWCRIRHMPAIRGASGEEVLSTTEVAVDIESMAMLLSGKWAKDPM